MPEENNNHKEAVEFNQMPGAEKGSAVPSVSAAAAGVAQEGNQQGNSEALDTLRASPSGKRRRGKRTAGGEAQGAAAESMEEGGASGTLHADDVQSTSGSAVDTGPDNTERPLEQSQPVRRRGPAKKKVAETDVDSPAQLQEDKQVLQQSEPDSGLSGEVGNKADVASGQEESKKSLPRSAGRRRVAKQESHTTTDTLSAAESVGSSESQGDRRKASSPKGRQQPEPE